MIRFLLVLLAFVSALLAFMFQETLLFVASGGLLMVSVVLLLLQVREQSKRKNRLKLPNDLTPQDELRARGVLEIRPKAKSPATSVAYAPPVAVSATEEELKQLGILEVREKRPAANPDQPALETPIEEAPSVSSVDESEPGTPEIPWSVVADEEDVAASDLFGASLVDAEEPKEIEPVDELDEIKEFDESTAEAEPSLLEEPVVSEADDPFAPQPIDAVEEDLEPHAEAFDLSEILEPVDEVATPEVVDEPEDAVIQEVDDVLSDQIADAEAIDAEEASRNETRELERHRAARRRVEVDAHLPALQTSLGAHTICLIDVDTDTSVYRLRSIVSSGLVDNAGTEYPFAGFFLSDLLAETTVIDIGPTGLAVPDLRYHKDPVLLEQVIASPVMKGGLPAAFLVAGFESRVDESSKLAVTQAAAFFSSLYALQEDHPSRGDSPLARAKRKPPSLRLVKSNPKSSQSKIIAEEMTRARGESYPLALALVCLDRGDEISRSDELTVYQVEEWMRRCLEQITPDGRIEYLGELGYGIIQLRDVSDVEGWVRRAQQIFRSQHGPVDAHPIVGVAMLSEVHHDPEDLQADAVRALRAAYETGDSTILVG